MTILGHQPDPWARAELREHNANTGDTVEMGAVSFVDGVLYSNPTGGPLTVPSPTTVASMVAAGFEVFTGSGGTPTPPQIPATAVEVTFSELTSHIDASTLIPGSWYKITDYRSVNTTSFDMVHTGDIEPIYVRAASVNTINRTNVLSAVWPNDVMVYDESVKYLLDSTGGEWEDGDSMGALNIVNITATSFDVQAEVVLNSNLHIEAEDDNGDIFWSMDDEGTAFTLTYPSPGVTRITALLGDIVFNDAAFNYGFIECDVVTGDRYGLVISRRDVSARIETSYDFRGYKFARKKIDLAAIPDHVAGTNYSQGSVVKRSNTLYYAMVDTDALVDDNTWVILLRYADTSYVMVGNVLGPATVPLEATAQLFSTFNLNGVANYDGITDVTIHSEDVVFNKNNQWTYTKQLTIGAFCWGLTFLGSVVDIDIPSSSYNWIQCLYGNLRNVVISSRLSDMVFYSIIDSTLSSISRSCLQTVNTSTIHRMQNAAVKSSYKSDLGGGYKTFFGSVDSCKFGLASSYSFFHTPTNITIGNAFQRINALHSFFKDSDIGNKWKRITLTQRFQYVTIGHSVGPNTGTLTITGEWFYVEVGSVCFYNAGTVLNTVRISRFANNVDIIDVPGVISGSDFGGNCRRIQAASIYNTVFSPYCQRLKFAGNIQQCTFAPNSRRITSGYAGVFAMNDVFALDFTVHPDCTELFDQYTVCNIRRGAAAILYTFHDASNKLITKDVDAGVVISTDVASDSTPDAALGGSLTQDVFAGDPADPAVGKSVMWVSDGTGAGNAGDVMVKTNIGGVVHTRTISAY